MVNEANNLAGRVWLVEQRQAEILKRLERIDERLDTLRQRQDENRYRLEVLERTRIEKPTWLDPTVMKILGAVFVAALLGLAGGRLATVVGLLQ